VNCDFHVHSNHSFDCLMSPVNVVRAAKRRGLSTISVTDHDTMAAYEAELTRAARRRLYEDHGVWVVPGMEIRTDTGDVIGLFLDEAVSATAFDEAVAAIRDQGGLVVLPHPFHRDADPAALVDDVDLVEVRNGRCRPEQNAAAAALAERAGIPILGGSDAHMYWEIGRIRTALSADDFDITDRPALKTLLLDGERDVRGTPLPYCLTHGVSYASGRLKELIQR